MRDPAALEAVAVEGVIVLQLVGVDSFSVAPVDPAALVCDGVERAKYVCLS